MDSTTDLKAIQKESFAQDRMEIDPEYVAMLPAELFLIRTPDIELQRELRSIEV